MCAGRKNQEAFTFLELLLVLVLLSTAAAMAYPRLSGTYDSIRIRRHKESIRTFVVHGERLARMSGEIVLLDWDSEVGRFQLYKVPHEQSSLSPTGAQGMRLREDVSPKSFYEFTFLNPALPGFERSQVHIHQVRMDRQGAPRSKPGFEDLVLTETCSVGRSSVITVIGFPVLLGPRGVLSSGAIRVLNGSLAEELSLEPGSAVAPVWRELGS